MGIKVLVIDDNFRVNKVLNKNFTEFGISVDSAYSFEDAINFLNKKTYHIIICDSDDFLVKNETLLGNAKIIIYTAFPEKIKHHDYIESKGIKVLQKGTDAINDYVKQLAEELLKKDIVDKDNDDGIYETALKRIVKWRLNENENARLYLFSLNLSSIPGDLFSLNKLQELSLDKNNLTRLPKEISNLRKLRELELHHNHILELPPEIGELKNLQKLLLSDNNLTQIPVEICKLKKLKYLDLNNNNLVNLPREITQLHRLKYFDLRGNPDLKIPIEITEKVNEPKIIINYYEAFSRILNCQKEEEAELNLSNLQLCKLPEEINQLNNLQNLNLQRNKLIEIKDIKNLISLISLKVQHNEITDISFIKEFKDLIELDISHNPIHDISFVKELNNLKELNIIQTKVENIEFLKEIENLKTLSLDSEHLEKFADTLVELKSINLILWENGQVTKIPIEVFSQFKFGEDLHRYYFKTSEGYTKELNEAKVLVVGEASVGKSSLIRRLVIGDYIHSRIPTEGIIINKDWKVKVNTHEVQLNIWDFGGQEIMHATHQFFLTKRSLYLLLLDSTLDEEANRIEYWLEKIKILGGNSPVIIVKNKSDLKQLTLNQKGLSSEFPNIKGFYDISCQSNEGISLLKNEIINETGKIKGIHDDLPIAWFNVKETLENSESDFISYQEYRELCKEKGVEEKDEERLINLLHNLGTVLNFKDDLRINDETNVLNPHWVTDGVYKIINDRQLFDSKGILQLEMLRNILENSKYPIEKQLFLIDMMKKFELCFEIPEAKHHYLLPDLLSKEELNTGNWTDSLKFEFHYNVFFSSIFSRLMVKMHKIVSKSTYWKTGMVLEYKIANEVVNEALIEVQTTKTKNAKIVISIRGNENTRRDFLSQIRGKLSEIHGSFPKEFEENFEERVSIPQNSDISVSYKHLLKLERINEEYIIPEGLIEKIKVKDLLNGIETPEESGAKSNFLHFEKQIEDLTKQIEPLKLIKEKCDKVATTRGKNKAHLLIAVYSLFVILILLIAVYYGFTFIGIIISFLIFLTPTIISNLRGKEWTFSKASEQLIAAEKNKNYEMANFDDNEYYLKCEELNKLKLEVKAIKGEI